MGIEFIPCPKDVASSTGEYVPVQLPFPGRRARIAARIAQGLLLAILSVLSLTMGLPVQAAELSPSDYSASSINNPALLQPRLVGADQVPDLSMPKTVMSSVDSLIGVGGVVQDSPDNVTLYNLGVMMRLLGGPLPHDELLARDHSVLSSLSFWTVETQVASAWVPLPPRTTTLTVLGTNKTGTYVVRTMQVGEAPSLGELKVVYKTTSSGSLKWDLGFSPTSSGRYRLVYAWHGVSNTLEISADKKQVRSNYAKANYTLSWADVPASFNVTTNVSPGRLSLYVDLGTLQAGSKVWIDPTIGSTNSPTATGDAFQRRVFYEPKGGYYFAFYYDGYSIQYSSSQDGLNWPGPQSVPPPLPLYYDEATSMPYVLNIGQTVLLLVGEVPRTFTGWGRGEVLYANGSISGPTITWQPDSPSRLDFLDRGCPPSAPTCQVTVGTRYVSATLDSNGYLVFSYNWYASGPGQGVCDWTASSESIVVVAYRGLRFFASCSTNSQYPERSVVLPGRDGVEVVYQFHTGSGVELRSRKLYGGALTTVTATPDKDTYVSSYTTDNYNLFPLNAGQNTSLIVSFNSQLSQRWAYIHFNLPAIPSWWSMIASASLSVWAESVWGCSPCATEVAPRGEDWNEYDAKCCSNPVTNSLPPGGNSDPYSEEDSTYKTTWSSLAVSPGTSRADVTYMVRSWYSGKYPNYGLILWWWTSYGEYVLNSRENSNHPPLLELSYACCIGNIETIDGNVPDTGEFSGVSDADFTTHIVYKITDGTNARVRYIYRAPSDTVWTHSPDDVFSGVVSDPTLTLDYSTNDLYAFVIDVQGSSIAMKSKPAGYAWRDRSKVYPVMGVKNGMMDLGSNMISMSSTNLNRLSLIWTNGTNSNFSVMYAGVPIPSVWSPFASPSDPWDGNGVTPYGQYFANLGEYVSTSTGLLTVRQSDLSVPGRGLNLEFVRVYAEPYGFFGNQPYNYENYPWAPLGNGWQLNFPWMSRDIQPVYIHLSDGEGYRIPSTFWSTGYFENHQGEQFSLLKNSTGIFLYTRSGTSFAFGQSNSLTKIVDPLGNKIAFTYDTNYRISKVTDTIGRIFLLCYDLNGFLSSIKQVASGSCGSEIGLVRSVGFGHDGQTLISATDPALRITQYQYRTVGSPGQPWLLSSITYPTGWHTDYAYNAAALGAASLYTYRVSRQTVSPSTGPQIRHVEYVYTQGPGDQVISSKIITFNGTSPQPSTHTDYEFSFTGVTWKSYDDSTSSFVRGIHQSFGAQGEAPKEIVLLSDGSSPVPVGSYANYYRYDLWGNLIYSRRAIDSSANGYHEGFNAYSNDGLAAGFYYFADTFNSLDSTRSDNSWNAASNGLWRVESGEYAVSGTGENETKVELPHGDAVFQAKIRPIDGTNFEAYLGFRYQANGDHYRVSLSTTSGLLFESVIAGTPRTLTQFTLNGGITPNTQYLIKVQSSGYYHDVYFSAGNSPLTHAFQVYDESFRDGQFLAIGVSTASHAPIPAQAQFDEILVQPLPGTFTNAFLADIPGPNIHDRLAGTAEFQDGPGSARMEAYYSYDLRGEVSLQRQRYDSSSGLNWLSTTMTYDAFGNPKTITDPKGNVAYYAYNATYSYAYLANSTRINGSTKISTLYNQDGAAGYLLSSKDPMGNVTSYRYDILGRVTDVTYPIGGLQYRYSDAANYVNASNANGLKTRQVYDGLGRLVRVERFSGSVTYVMETYRYDGANRVIAKTDAMGRVTGYEYDVVGRVVQVTEPDQNHGQVFYNELNSWVRAVDEQGTSSCNYYDRLGRLISIVENASSACLPGIVTNYYYDEVGNLLKVTNAVAKSTTHSYDNLNQLTSTTYPDASFENYTYDNKGNLASKTDRNRIVIGYSYDSIDRLTTVTYYGTSSQDVYVYDKNSNLLQLTSQNATNTYTYDARNRALSERYDVNGGVSGGGGGGGGGGCGRACPNGPTHRSVSTASTGGAAATYLVYYHYNGELLDTITYPDGLVVKYAYDSLGRVSSVSKLGSAPYATFSYYNDDRLKDISFGNGLTGDYTYDNRGMSKDITLLKPGEATPSLLSLSYQYYSTGTVANVYGFENGVTATVNEQYSYDSLGRLTYATVKGGGVLSTLSYTYDSLGNRATQTVNGTLTTYSYDLNNNELTYASGGSNNHYTYDANGNLRSQAGSAIWAYTWDASGHLSSVDRNFLPQSRYAYDGMGRKVESVEGSTTTFYAYLGTETLYEQVYGQSTATDYVYAAGLRIAKVTSLNVAGYYHTWRC